MLMRIREQKGWIRGIFIALILVFASSFVIGGVAQGTNFSLSDIIGNGGGSSSSADTGGVGPLLKQVKLHPNNAALWTQLSEAYSTNNQTPRQSRPPSMPRSCSRTTSRAGRRLQASTPRRRRH